MSIKAIAKKNGVTERTVHYIINGDRHTALYFLAIDIAAFTGERPIKYIRPKMRPIFMRVMPELIKKQ